MVEMPMWVQSPSPPIFFNYFQKKIKGFELDTDNYNMRNFLNNIFGDTRDTFAQAIIFFGVVAFFIGGMVFALSPYVLVFTN